MAECMLSTKCPLFRGSTVLPWEVYRSSSLDLHCYLKYMCRAGKDVC